MLPQIGIDANFIGCQIMNYIYSLRSKCNPSEPMTISVSTVNGGNIVSSISEYMKISGPIRSLNL